MQTGVNDCLNKEADHWHCIKYLRGNDKSGTVSQSLLPISEMFWIMNTRPVLWRRHTLWAAGGVLLDTEVNTGEGSSWTQRSTLERGACPQRDGSRQANKANHEPPFGIPQNLHITKSTNLVKKRGGGSEVWKKKTRTGDKWRILFLCCKLYTFFNLRKQH